MSNGRRVETSHKKKKLKEVKTFRKSINKYITKWQTKAAGHVGVTELDSTCAMTRFFNMQFASKIASQTGL